MPVVTNDTIDNKKQKVIEISLLNYIPDSQANQIADQEKYDELRQLRENIESRALCWNALYSDNPKSNVYIFGHAIQDGPPTVLDSRTTSPTLHIFRPGSAGKDSQLSQTPVGLSGAAVL